MSGEITDRLLVRAGDQFQLKNAVKMLVLHWSC